MNEFYKHKSDKIKWALTGVAFLLVAVMLTGICLQLFGKGKQKPSEWFKKDEVCEHVDSNNDGVCDECGEDMTTKMNNVQITLPETDENGIKLTKTLLSTAQYAEYGISTQAESAFTINAVAYAPDGSSPDVYQDFTWDMSWTKTKSAPVIDYIKMTTNGAQAVFECLKGFDTQIKVNVTSKLVPSVKKTATFDYYKRLESFKMLNLYADNNGSQVSQTVSDGTVFEGYFGTWNGYDTDFELEWLHMPESYTYGIGTVADNIAHGSVTLSFSDSFKTKLNSYSTSFKYTTQDFDVMQSDNVISSIDSVCSNLVTSSLSYQTKGYYLAQALAATTNQVKMVIGLVAASGIVYNFTCYLNVRITAQSVSNVKLNGVNSDINYIF